MTRVVEARLRLNRAQPFIDELDGNACRLTYLTSKLASTPRGQALATVHVTREADQEASDFLLADEPHQLAQRAWRRCCDDEIARVGHQPELVCDGNPDAGATIIECQNPARVARRRRGSARRWRSFALCHDRDLHPTRQSVARTSGRQLPPQTTHGSPRLTFA